MPVRDITKKFDKMRENIIKLWNENYRLRETIEELESENAELKDNMKYK